MRRLEARMQLGLFDGHRAHLFRDQNLVSCPVVLYPASTSVEKTRFHMINKETGNRLKQQMIDAETGDVVESDQKGRGYELKKGQYVEIEKEELEAVQIGHAEIAQDAPALAEIAGQRVGIKEVDEGIWIVSFMQYDLGYIDLEQKTLQPLDNPFGPRLLPMS